MTEVYIVGRNLSKHGTVCLPLTSSAIIFVIKYCQSVPLKLVIVDDNSSDECVIQMTSDSFNNLNHIFVNEVSLPPLIKNCSLPVVYDSDAAMIRSGLCCTVRHIISLAHAHAPDDNFQDLLGFRQGSLRMCAEVSGWTKLCEMELNTSIALLIRQIRQASSDEPINIPNDLVKLEVHLKTLPVVHNDNKIKRRFVKMLKTDVQDPQKKEDILKSCNRENTHLILEKNEIFPHGIRQYRCKKMNVFEKEDSSISINKKENICDGMLKLSLDEENNSADLVAAIMKLTFLDVELTHLYLEGIEMTIADIIVFVYFYHLMESIQFKISVFKNYFPKVLQWFSHISSIKQIQNASASCCFKLESLRLGLLESHLSDLNVRLILPEMPASTNQNIELSRRNKSNFKAYKPDVTHVLKKIKDSMIHVQLSEHPCGKNVELPWDKLPSGVHPREGTVPEKRVRRKCQQLENLVTAVMNIAKKGNIIIDFCSGGGHLGIVIAYMLPDCKVYMIENKEESLMKAKQRVDQLGLTNVVLYQCNLEYFNGYFDIGVSLHACGVATDMVLQHCLDKKAAFVVCPCCYGSIQKTDEISYPRSQVFTEAGITYKEFLTLGHAADQTEFNIKLESQGRYCSNLVDTDRAQFAKENGFQVRLCSLHPPSCTPKNNLLIGTSCKYE